MHVAVLLFAFALSSGKDAPTPDLRGSHASLVLQNQEAQKAHLAPVKNPAELRLLVRPPKKSKQQPKLVRLPANKTLRVDSKLVQSGRNYCLPFVRDYLLELGKDFSAKFPKRQLQVNSAVRTVTFQKSLRRRNGNAAPISGETMSSHLYGTTVDVTKKPLRRSEVEWLRARLARQQQAGKIIVEEEFRQVVFHIMVIPPVPKAPLQSAGK